MKTSIPVFAVLCAAVIFLNSFAISKDSVLQPKYDAGNGKEEPSSSCYVVMSDGSIQNYSTLKLVTGVLITPHLVADNKVTIHAKDIKAYQDNQHYAVSQKLLT